MTEQHFIYRDGFIFRDSVSLESSDGLIEASDIRPPHSLAKFVRLNHELWVEISKPQFKILAQHLDMARAAFGSAMLNNPEVPNN
jgi:hypothetical protein